jgi:hypothetical protein
MLCKRFETDSRLGTDFSNCTKLHYLVQFEIEREPDRINGIDRLVLCQVRAEKLYFFFTFSLPKNDFAKVKVLNREVRAARAIKPQRRGDTEKTKDGVLPREQLYRILPIFTSYRHFGRHVNRHAARTKVRAGLATNAPPCLAYRQPEIVKERSGVPETRAV